jgi:hypothetical protein
MGIGAGYEPRGNLRKCPALGRQLQRQGEGGSRDLAMCTEVRVGARAERASPIWPRYLNSIVWTVSVIAVLELGHEIL